MAIPGRRVGARWEFPTLTWTNARGATAHWRITVTRASFTTESWTGRAAATTTAGRHAATTAVVGRGGRTGPEQALLEAHSKWVRKSRAVSHGALACGRVPPMLLKTYDAASPMPPTDHLYVQRKYNGVRCMLCVAPAVPPVAERRAVETAARLYSRNLHVYELPEVTTPLAGLMRQHPRLILDGELYVHGVDLQHLSGVVRRGADAPGAAADLRRRVQYVVFDVLDLDRPQAPYADRLTLLRGLRLPPPAVLAETFDVGAGPAAAAAVAARYRQFLREGYEGAVVRRGGRAYVPGFNGRHTDAALKLKPTRSDEFEVVGYAEGRGRDAGAVIWECAAPSRGYMERHPRAARRTFSVRPAQPYAERRAVFAELARHPRMFAVKYKGRPLTVEYAELSADGVPLQPRAIVFRDFE